MEMEFLRRILNQIQTQLGGLTVSQKMVIALLLIFMAASIFFMVSYAAEKEKVALLNKSFSQDELNRIVNQLNVYGEEFEVRGTQIWVLKSDWTKIIAQLGFDEVLPENTSGGWDLLLNDKDIWVPDSHRKDKKNIVLQGQLARAISMWPGVNKASVFINPGDKRRLGNITPVASASVFIESTGNISAKKLAVSAASFVSGANNRMKRENVIININGKNIPVVSQDDEIDSDYIAKKVQYEEYFTKKIRDILPGMDAIVQVDVKWKNTRSEIHKKEFKGEISWNPDTEVQTRETDDQNQDIKQEPGLVANASNQNTSGGRMQKSTSSDDMAKKAAFPGSIETIQRTGMGGTNMITASVSIADEYFKEKATTQSGQEADNNTVQALIAKELPDIRKSVMTAIGLQENQADQVFITTHWAGGLLADTVPQEDPSMVSTMMAKYGEPVAVTALACISLLMVFMMVRKTVGPVEVSEEEALAMMAGDKPLDALGLEDSNIDDGEEGDALLSGMELDEESIRSQQVLQQIREMIEEAPDNATNLIQKWITEED